MNYFDWQKTASEAQIPPGKLDELAGVIRRDFPHDEMMYELHLLRACTAIRDGIVTLERALQPEQSIRT